jgi:hypothetical protein
VVSVSMVTSQGASVAPACRPKVAPATFASFPAFGTTFCQPRVVVHERRRWVRRTNVLVVGRSPLMGCFEQHVRVRPFLPYLGEISSLPCEDLNSETFVFEQDYVQPSSLVLSGDRTTLHG